MGQFQADKTHCKRGHESLWTHFAQVPLLGQHEYERMKDEDAAMQSAGEQK